MLFSKYHNVLVYQAEVSQYNSFFVVGHYQVTEASTSCQAANPAFYPSFP